VTEQQWGRVDADGTVWVRAEGGERAVGQYPGATPQEALAYFTRKFDELVAQVNLFEQRLRGTDLPAADARAGLQRLREAVVDAHAVGDLHTLSARIESLADLVTERERHADAERAAARERARAERTAVVEEAERIAATDGERLQWKASGDRLRELFEAWKQQQRSAIKLDRRSEDELWKRFSAARTTFDRKRRQHFSHLEQVHGQAKAAKEALVREAEELSTSTDWGATAAAYRRLMERWKAAGRAARKDDDALWARFRAAQDVFFAARAAANAETDAQYRDNLVVKERLAAEAEALLPVTDPASARAALRDLQARWDAAGKVPRVDVARLDTRLRAVEQAVAGADEERWRRSNPEARARAEAVVQQLEQGIGELEKDVARAHERGDARALRSAEEGLQARRSWLDEARRTLAEFSG
jgi:exonuclease VII small subunit